MDPYLAPPGIRFNDYLFSEPARISACAPPRCAGLYVVLAPDPNWAPKPFQPVCFTELGNNAPKNAMLEECAGLTAPSREWFVAVLPLPFSTTAQRRAIRSELIRAYNPLLQMEEARASSGDLARKFDELEKKYQAQTAQLMLLLAGNPPGETQRPRRRIGFVPQTES